MPRWGRKRRAEKEWQESQTADETYAEDGDGLDAESEWEAEPHDETVGFEDLSVSEEQDADPLAAEVAANEDADSTLEQGVVEGSSDEAESEEWPEWAYGERRSRRRKGRRSRRRGGRRATDVVVPDEVDPLFDPIELVPDLTGDVEEEGALPTAGDASEEEPVLAPYEPPELTEGEPDEAPEEADVSDLNVRDVEVGETIDLPEIWTSGEEAGVPPVWSPEEEQRLRDVESLAAADVLAEDASAPVFEPAPDPVVDDEELLVEADPLPAPVPGVDAPFDAATVFPEPPGESRQDYDPPQVEDMPSGWTDERLAARAEALYDDDEDAYDPDDDEEGYDSTDDDDVGYDDRYESYEDEERSYQPVVGDVLPGGLGPRRAALHERRRKRRRASAAFLAAALVAGVLGVSMFGGGDDDSDDDERNPSGGVVAAGDDSVETMLLFGTKESATEAGAVWLTLLSIDREENTGSVVYMPSHIAVEVPGRGLLPLGESLSSEEVPLLLVSTESLLGIEIDSYLELSDRDARVLFESFGGLTVDVPAEVTVSAGGGQARLLFPEGEQQLDGAGLEDLLYVQGIQGDDVELGSRHLAFWDSLFESFADRTEELEAAIEASSAVLGESDRTAEENADYLGDLASLPEESVVFNSLPVEQASVGQEELYSVNEGELATFVRDTIGARITPGDEIRVQILNGNGVPGIGAEVAEVLGAEDYRVILAGNAQRLDYKKTLIITYDRSSEGIDRAERAMELIGVGEVQVSGQDQGIVDLTIVVGKDFLGRT